MNADSEESHFFLPSSASTWTNNARKMKNPDEKFYLRKRYFVSLWTCVGYMILMTFGSNVSMALVELTTDKKVTVNGTTIIKKAELDWDYKTQGFVMSSIAFGFLLSPIGGVLAAKFGGVRTFGLGIFVSSILTISTSFFLYSNFAFLAIGRFILGIFESSAVASFLNVFTSWAPPHERSRLVAFGFTGFYAGLLVTFSVGGFLIHNYGVQSIFTITGTIGLIWSIIWTSFVSNDPLSDRFITSKERKYFENYISPDTKVQNMQPKNYPWKLIFTSKPAWAIFNEHFCLAWLVSFITGCLPLYIRDSFDVNVEQVGYISSIPVFGNFMGVIVFSIIADYLRSSEILPIAAIHRLFAAIGQISCAVFLLLISLWANYIQSVILFTIMRFFAGAAEITYNVAIIDMFAEYSGIIRGVATTCFTVTSLLNPIVMGYIVTDHSRASWNLYFLFLSIFNIFGLIVFYMYGSGELQEWAAPKLTDESIKKNSGTQMDKM